MIRFCVLTHFFPQWTSLDALNPSANAQIQAGYAHKIKLEYYALNALNGIQLSWSSDGINGNIMKRQVNVCISFQSVS